MTKYNNFFYLEDNQFFYYDKRDSKKLPIGSLRQLFDEIVGTRYCWDYFQRRNHTYFTSNKTSIIIIETYRYYQD